MEIRVYFSHKNTKHSVPLRWIDFRNRLPASTIAGFVVFYLCTTSAMTTETIIIDATSLLINLNRTVSSMGPIAPSFSLMLDIHTHFATALTMAHGMLMPIAIVLCCFMLVFLWLLRLVNADHTFLSLLKMNTKGSRPPVAPFGMFECIHNMTSDQQPWFPLSAKKALNDADTFVLPLPRRPVMTGDYALAREILTDPGSFKPRTYQEFEPMGVGSIFTRNGHFWVSASEVLLVSNGTQCFHEFARIAFLERRFTILTSKKPFFF